MRQTQPKLLSDNQTEIFEEEKRMSGKKKESASVWERSREKVSEGVRWTKGITTNTLEHLATCIQEAAEGVSSSRCVEAVTLAVFLAAIASTWLLGLTRAAGDIANH